MRASRLLSRPALVLGAALAGCGGDVPEGPVPPLARVASELGMPPPDTMWLRERDLDGPLCVLRIERTSSEGIRAVAGADADPDAGVDIVPLDPFGAPGDSVRVEGAGTACARGVYGDRPVEGGGYLAVTDTTGGRVVAAFAADLSAAGGRFARAGRAVRILGTVHLAPELAEVAP